MGWIVLFDRGFIRFGTPLDSETELVGDEDDGVAESTLVVESSGNWEQALIVLIDSMSLYDKSDAPFTAAIVPPYQTSSFWFSGDVQHRDIWWGADGVGFGQYVMGARAGYPTLLNECMSKNSIYRVFQQIRFAKQQ